ncbi:MAG: hypothetical protein KBD01_04280 [Acidobacteria bacterium]|nr:hypothetical protein [Acidobacteriota bacterium]
MSRRSPIVVTIAVFALAAAAEAPGVRVNVLPEQEAAIEELRPLPGAAGSFELPGDILLDSLHAEWRPGGETIALSGAPPVRDLDGLLRACLGQRVDVLPAGSEGGAPEAESARLVGGDPQRALVRLPDQRLGAIPWWRVACATERSERWLFSAGAPAPGTAREVLLRYRQPGWSWHALHRLELREGLRQATLATEALIDVPAGVDLPQAQLAVTEGSVPRGGTQPVMMAKARMAESFAQAPAQETSAMDLVVFDLPGTQRLAGPRTLLLPLRPAASVGIEDLLVTRVPWAPAGGPDDQRVVPQRHVKFLVEGAKPLPAGSVEVGVRTADKWLLLGNIPTERVAPGDTADLALGEVRDLVVRWRRVELAPLTATPYRFEAGVEIDIENRRPLPASVELVQPMGGPYELIQADPAPDQRDGASATWKLGLDKNAVRTIRFRARVEPRTR